jgi:hypothetical protein
MTHLVRQVFILAVVASLSLPQALAQGETTSAIVGQIRDTTNAVVPGATVTITNPEAGLRRSAKTDDSGRFNFPQLKPGTYSVRVEASGFEPRHSGFWNLRRAIFRMRRIRWADTARKCARSCQFTCPQSTSHR